MTILTAANPKITETIKDDTYELGWRDILHPLPDGGYHRERVPLTLEDILHPQIGDFRMHSRDHQLFCLYLHNVFSACIANDPTAVILHDVRVAWATSAVKPHGPDISVIFGIKEDRNWATFDEVVEGTKPTIVVEVTSPKTRQVDLIEKVDEYAQVGVQFYIIVDGYKRKGKETLQLLGYQLMARKYVALQPNKQARLWLPPLKIWLGIDNNKLHCYDEAGMLMEDYTQIMAARAEAENRAQAAETQIREMKAELRRLRGKAN